MPDDSTIGIDANEIKEKVRKAVAQAGRHAALIGFEAVEIQRFVAASSRPITIQGASKALEQFDSKNESQLESIFAGGARGLLIVPSDRVDFYEKKLKDDFKEKTVGLSLAVAHALFDPNNEAASLQWLWHKQRAAHDACDPEEIDFQFPRGVCVDCRARPATFRSQKPEAKDEWVCARCSILVNTGRNHQKGAGEWWTMSDLLEDYVSEKDLKKNKRLIGLVCADGNRLGTFFHSLNTLRALRAGSIAVNRIFKGAHDAAIAKCGTPRHVAPVTGGDDIKVFMAPEIAIDYVSQLIKNVEKNSKSIAAENLGGLIGEKPVELLAKLGIGVGLLIAPLFLPTPMLVDMALGLEREAKTISANTSGSSDNGVRSAVAVGVLKTESERQKFDELPIPAANWPDFVNRARSLREVKSSQRADAQDAFKLDELERKNLFRYQIARSDEWRAWFDKSNIDWRNREELDQNIPTRNMLAIASLEKKSL